MDNNIETITDIGVNFVIKVGGLMASAEREAITEVWGRSPQRGPGQSPWSGGRSHPEAESILSFTSANGAQICQFLLPCKLLKYAFLGDRL